MIYASMLYVMGWLLVLLAAASLLPFSVAFFMEEEQALRAFGVTFFVTLFIAGILLSGFRRARSAFSKKDLLFFVVLVWLFVPVAGAAPFLLSGVLDTPLDAFFEAMSGITTTGATLISDLDSAPRALLLWRAILQWLGGWASIILAAAILVFLGIGGMELRMSPLTRGGEAGDFLSRLVSTAKVVGRIYIVLTILAVLGFWITGLRGIEAVCLALSAVSTGGFTTSNAGLSAYPSAGFQVWLIIIMLAGSLNFATHRQAVRNGTRAYTSDPETFYLLGVSGIAVVLIWISSFLAGKTEISLMTAIFTGISLVTTSGWIPAGSGALDGVSPLIFLLVPVIGGATLSTAGGIKLMRMALLFKQSVREINRLAYPSGIIRSRFGERSFNMQLMKRVWVLFLVFMTTLVFAALLLSATGIPFEAALAASSAAITNTGPAYVLSIHAGLAGPLYTDFPDSAKTVIIAAMFLGRIEMLAFFGLFNPVYWRN